MFYFPDNANYYIITICTVLPSPASAAYQSNAGKIVLFSLYTIFVHYGIFYFYSLRISPAKTRND